MARTAASRQSPPRAVARVEGAEGVGAAAVVVVTAVGVVVAATAAGAAAGAARLPR